MVGTMALIIPLLIIIVVGLVIAGIKGSSEEGGDVMKNAYVYLVLFATLMMVIGGSVAAFMAGADLVAPAPYHQTYEEFKRWGVDKDGADQVISEDELKERYDSMVKAERERQSIRAKNNLIKSFGWIVIPLPVFLYFQKRMEKKKQ